MNKKTLFLTLLLTVFSSFQLTAKPRQLVISTKQIILDEFPDAFHPSILKTDFGYLAVFRYCPDRKQDCYSYVGIVRLNETFDPISPPQLLNMRVCNLVVPSQAEDARIFSVGSRIYITYNDNPEVIIPTIHERRDIYIAEILEDNGLYSIGIPLKLMHETKYETQLWQKNWVPFEWHQRMLISYSISPHEVLAPDMETGNCPVLFSTTMNYQWKKGSLRGGTPAQLVGSKYLAFFHSSMKTASSSSCGKKMHHYYMGAYTFDSDPPFGLKKISSTPIIGEGFYTRSDCDKRIIFPCGFVVDGDVIYVSYGKDDRELWVATLDKKQLEESMRPVY